MATTINMTTDVARQAYWADWNQLLNKVDTVTNIQTGDTNGTIKFTRENAANDISVTVKGISNCAFIATGSDTTKFLRNDGSWQVPSYYQHPTSDGNKHVPATGTTSNGKVLIAGSTAGSFSWKSLADAGISATGHTHTFASLTSKPTTLSGYGITDAATSGHNHTGTYVRITGDTMTGGLVIRKSDSESPITVADGTHYTDNTFRMVMTLNHTNGLHGLWSSGFMNDGTFTGTTKWICYRDKAGDVYLNGQANCLPDRTLTIGSTGKTFNGTANVSWTLAEIGAAAASHGTHVSYGTSTAKIGTSSAGSATTVSRSDHVHAIDLATGDSNGQVKIAGSNVSVKGLAALAYKASVAWSEITSRPSNAGGSLTPVYWSSNAAVACDFKGWAANSSGQLFGIQCTAGSGVSARNGHTMSLVCRNDGIFIWDATSSESVWSSSSAYAAAGHTHSYIPLSGSSSITGNLVGTKAGEIYYAVKNTNTSCQVYLDSAGSYHGIYSNGYWDGSAFQSGGKWMIYRNNAGTIIVNGNCTGTAANITGTLAVGNGGTGKTTLTSGELLVGNGTSAINTKAIYSLSAVGNLGWGTTANRTKIPDIGCLAYWDGTYNGSSSNLSHCNKGAFGSIITLNKGSSTNSFLRNDGTWTTALETNGTMQVSVKNTGNNAQVSLHVSTNGGVYSNVDGGWIVYTNQTTGGRTGYVTTQYAGFQKAVWNDYAEAREAEITEPGRSVYDDGTGCMKICNNRLQPAARIISDTFGFLVGKSNTCKTPIGVGGRVLAYPYQNKNNYHVGDAVCAAPNGTIDIMTREEIMMYPDRIIGIVSEIPDYEIWDNPNDGPIESPESEKANVKVNGRIWVYVR